MEGMKEPRGVLPEAVLDALPDHIQAILRKIPATLAEGLEEIRIRENRPLMVSSLGRDYFLSGNGEIASHPSQAYWATRADSQRILQLISNFSIYAMEEEIRNGYVTLKGGFRVGLAGKAVLEDGKVKTLKYINSFNIRISREVIGAARKVLPYIIKNREVCHTLVISPPQMGKTTMLRDIARNLSDGFSGFPGIKTAIVDERSEIAGCYKGVPQMRIGLQTDVLDACPKAVGIMMLIRSMSPRVIITDELGRDEDVEAVEEALNAGIKIISSAHGKDIEDLFNRPIFSDLMRKKIFERFLVLGNSLGVGTLEKVYDGQFNILSKNPVR